MNRSLKLSLMTAVTISQKQRVQQRARALTPNSNPPGGSAYIDINDCIQISTFHTFPCAHTCSDNGLLPHLAQAHGLELHYQKTVLQEIGRNCVALHEDLQRHQVAAALSSGS